MISAESNKQLAEIYMKLAQQCLELARIYEKKGFENLAKHNREAADEFLRKHEYYMSKDDTLIS